MFSSILACDSSTERRTTQNRAASLRRPSLPCSLLARSLLPEPITAPKRFETQERMTLENLLRGTGDIGAMLATCWGLRQIDPVTNRVFVQCVKGRDFDPCEPFIIEGRPHLDDTGHFRLVSKPGTAGELRDHMHARAGRRADSGKEEKIQQASELRAQGKSFEQIASTLGVSKGTISKWFKSHAEDVQ